VNSAAVVQSPGAVVFFIPAMNAMPVYRYFPQFPFMILCCLFQILEKQELMQVTIGKRMYPTCGNGTQHRTGSMQLLFKTERK